MTSASESSSAPSADWRYGQVCGVTVGTSQTAQQQQEEGRPEKLAVVRSDVIQTEKDGDGATGRIPDREGVGGGVRPQHRHVAALRAH
jgi:hypothetical protein